MAKRKREIKKRKKLMEETRADEDLELKEAAGDTDSAISSGLNGPGTGESSDTDPPVDDRQIIASRPPAAPKKKSVRGKGSSDSQPVAAAGPDSWYNSNKENLLLGLLILYVILLGLGTVGELFEIEWILNLPLFR